jgi:hypothetical protein
MRHLFLAVVAVFLDLTYAASPFSMNWSTQAYGPDGPWQAVTIEVGSKKQPVALYPGANYASSIMLDSVCSNTTLSSTCYAAEAGTYNLNESTSAVVLSTSQWQMTYWAVEGGALESVIGDQFSFGPTMPNASIQGVYQTYQMYPNGNAYPVQVGTLALGAPWTTDTLDNATLNMIASWLYTSGGDDAIPSYSYGMHIGSVSPAIAPSLVLGGYDSSRVVGDVSAQSMSLDPATSGELEIIMKDMGLGLVGDWIPPGFTSQTGLFLQNSGGTEPMNVTINPTVPYMYLPTATCDAIAASLPVSFDTSLGLYLWNTNNSNYVNITSSATYLSFVFDSNGTSAQNTTVKVPLAQLALTLQAPLVEENTTYFPCFPSTGPPVLGRAFLQAAFVGANWFEGENTGIWFLAQAPGPALSSVNITAMGVRATATRGSNSSWEQSWAKYWNIEDFLSTNSTNPSTTPNPASSTIPSTINSINSSSGLSTGAKAGIGIGVAIVGVILIAVAAWFAIIRPRRQKAETSKPMEIDATAPNIEGSGKPHIEEPLGELETRPLGELETRQLGELETSVAVKPQEMMGNSTPRYELG